MKRVLHLTTHLNIGGITSYIKLVTHEMKKMDYQFYVGSSGGTQEPYLEENGVKSIRLNIKTKSELSPKVYLSIAPLIHVIRKEKIDLIHAHTRVTQVLAWWVKRLTGIPYITTCHGFYKTRFGRRLMPAWGDRVIAISNPVADSLIRDFKVNPKKVTTIFNAIDIDELSERFNQKNRNKIRAELGLSPDCKVLGIVARIVEDKGHEYFLRAAQKLVLESFPSLKILIVGEGPFMKRARTLVKQLNLESAVIFLGNIQDVTYALVVIDVFILPAIWREGFGLSIIEAMAVSKPVIVTNIWSLNELITNRVNGLLVEPRDVDGLAMAIQELLSDERLRESVAQNGSKMVKKEFSIPQMASRVGQIYEAVVEKFK